MTIRPTKSLSTSNLQAVTIWLTNSDIRQHKWWLRPIQMVTIRQLYKKCSTRPAKRVHPTILKWWPSNSSDHTKSVHLTYMYTNDDHPRPKKVCIRPTNDDHSTHPIYKKCASYLYIYVYYTNDDHPTYKWWPSDLQKVNIRPTI